MFAVPTTLMSGGSAVETPDEIFGAALTDWFDARVGVTFVDNAGQDEVTDWANQATGGDASETHPSNRPNYTAVGSDGTPEVDFAVNNHGMAYTDTIPDEFTVWILHNGGGSRIGNLLWSDSPAMGLFMEGFPDDDKPAIYFGGWTQLAVADILGWHLTRFSIRDDGVGVSSIAVDADAEVTALVNWIPAAATWDYLSRISSAQAMDGAVKQILIVDEYVNDADSRHQDVLDYFKNLYPTLVSY